MNLTPKPSRIDFDELDVNQISRILKSGRLAGLTPAEQEYFNLMEVVRGLRARMLLPGGARLVTKAGIIRILREVYGLTDWTARRVYEDSINFFYSECSISPRAWSNLYADKLEKMADLAFSTGNFKDGRTLLTEAAKLRGCFDEAAPEIPEELLNQAATVVYTADAKSLGAPAADRKELEAFIDSLPEVPQLTRDRLKEDSGIVKKNILKRMMEDAKEFSEDAE